MLKQLWNDEYGVIISAELVFVLTILVIGMVVGLSELQHGVVQELDDIGAAIGHMNQTYSFSGFSAWKRSGKKRHVSFTVGSFFKDNADACDDCDGSSDISCDPPQHECGFGGWRGHNW